MICKQKIQVNGDMINSSRQEVIEAGKKSVEDLHSLQDKLSIAEKRRVFRKVYNCKLKSKSV